MAFEIPSARIRDLQAALRREAGFAAYDPADPSLPPLPSVADALAALDPPDLPSSLRCVRCGSGGGLLHGQQSTLCVYCGSDRGREGVSHSISFYSTAACRKLLDFLGLDGSEAVQLEIEPSSSSKGQTSAAPKDELVLSDLLDLKLEWPSDKEEVNADGRSKMPSTSMYNFNMTGLDIGTFFTETKREISSTLSSEKLTIEESSTDTVNNASTSSEHFAAFEDLQSLKPEIDTVHADDRQFGTSFAAWEAEFQPERSKSFVADPKTIDKLPDHSGSEFVQAPESVAGFNQQENKEQEINTKSTDDGIFNEVSSTSSINNWVPDDFWSVKPAEGNSSDQLKPEFDSRKDGYQIHNSSWPINTTEESGKPVSTNSNDDLFYESQGSATSSVAQGNLLDPMVQTETALFGHPSETKVTDLGSTTSKTELEFDEFVDANDGTHDNWQDFTSSSLGQENSADLGAKSVAMPSEDTYDDWQDFTSSSVGQEKSADLGVNSVIMPSEHPLETKSNHITPISGKLDLDDPLRLDTNDDSFDDWKDFTSSIKGQETPPNLGAQSKITLFEHPVETNSVDVSPLNKMESNAFLNVSNNDDIFDSWLGFTNSSKTKENVLHSGAQSMDMLLDYSSGTKMVEISSSGSKDLDSNKFFDYNDDSFDDWQGFTSSSGQILLTDSIVSKQHSGEKSVEACREPANGGNESLDSWFEFASSSGARGSSQKSGQQTVAAQVDRSSETMLECSEDVVFGSLDPLFDTSGILNYSTVRNDNKSNSLTSNRINNATDVDFTERNSNIFENSNAASNEESGNSKIEMLMSQIPDLSFMLTDELSLPVKLGVSDSKS